ncbi:MAG: serine/threonine-protein kinase [Gemmatimonadales bacterium]
MTEIPEQLGKALADRYRLERELGRGGMATVYLAEDTRHRREVAVKVFEPGVARAIGSDRFLREIEIAARLQHPHILTLIDSGERDGFLYYVMPYVAGDSLRALLERNGPPDPARIVALVREVASALDYAHRRGLLHRDIKPENILLSEGHAVVADFGIAGAITSSSETRLTRTGVPIGTPGYMSPEQAAGLTDLGPTSDVFSLGVVAYELVVGEPPGRWLTEEAVRVGKFVDASPAHRARLDRLPGAAERALARALAVSEGVRFPGPLELARTLEAAFGDRPSFSADQARRIVDRAAELEASHVTEDPPVTIGGVERLAADVGIPAPYVQAAAAELEANTTSPDPRRPAASVMVRRLPQLVDPAGYPALVSEMAATVGHAGLVSTLGRDLRWHMVTPGGRDLTVTISPGQGDTTITIEEKNKDLRTAWYFGAMGGAGTVGAMVIAAIAGKKLGNVALAIVGPIVWLAGCALAARFGFGKARAEREAELEGLMERLIKGVAEHRLAAPASRQPDGRVATPR